MNEPKPPATPEVQPTPPARPDWHKFIDLASAHGKRAVALATFAQRKAAVDKMGGNLEEHRCCPGCGQQEPTIEKDAASCPICGWMGQTVQLIDTVQTGATRLPA